MMNVIMMQECWNLNTVNANSQCKERVDASTQALKAYYKQLGTYQYNLNEALDALVTLTDRSQKLVHAEQQKKFFRINLFSPLYGLSRAACAR